MTATVHKKDNIKYELSLVGSSILIVLYLFYRDEGYYNFNWMKNIGTWIIFIEFTVILTVIQLLLYVFMGVVFKRLPIIFGTILSCLIGIPAGVTLLFVVGNYVQH